MDLLTRALWELKWYKDKGHPGKQVEERVVGYKPIQWRFSYPRHINYLIDMALSTQQV
jgi:hypothetical protein